MAISESSSTLVAGMVSFNGLVPLFGTTGNNGNSETEIGIMTVPSYNDWIIRLNKSSYSSGPTGAWAGEWWCVYNYLQYGGICVVGGTGSTGDYWSPTGVLTASNTPLHNKNLVALDVVFDGGNQNSVKAAADIAIKRQDCLAFVGNNLPIGSVTSPYNKHFTDFGVTANSAYVSFYAGRKSISDDVSVPKITPLIKVSTGPDAAGCLARTYRTASPWSSISGKTRGRILSTAAMESFDDTNTSGLIAGNVNTIQTFPGEGTFLMGNKNGIGGILNDTSFVTYLKKILRESMSNYLFEPNNSVVRASLTNTLTGIMNNILVTGGITTYNIVCDETNNTDITIAAHQLIVDVTVERGVSATSILINLTLTGGSTESSEVS